MSDDKLASRIYCGDGSALPNDYDRFGSRYECMQCGFGAAMMKYKWEPVSTDTKLPPREEKGCRRVKQHKKGVISGNQFINTDDDAEMREKYPEFASSPGEGDGEHDVEGESTKFSVKKKTIICIAVWFVLSAALFLALFFGKPEIVMVQTISTEKKKRIDWCRFLTLYCIVVLVCTCIMYFILRL